VDCSSTIIGRRLDATQYFNHTGDGFCEVYVNIMEGFWSTLRSWLRPHQSISQEKLAFYLGFFEFAHNARKRGKALLHTLIELLVT
jgi:transposase